MVLRRPPAPEKGNYRERALRIMTRNRSAAVLLFLLLSAAPVWAQTTGQENTSSPEQQQRSSQQSSQSPGTSDMPDAPPPAESPVKQEHKKESSEGQQTKRMYWVVPNFAAVSADTRLPPLSAHGKFALAMHDSMDYSSFIWAGILAGQSLALKADPELGHGIAGYGRYYWRTVADGLSGAFFTEAIVPAITHEDPRYYTLGHGGFFRRLGYALSRTLLTPTDSGHTTFNWSEVGGNGLEAALSNAYYPPQERGVHQTLRSWGTQMESATLNNVAKEFWPDIRRLLLRQK
jgi:hypothetical protein